VCCRGGKKNRVTYGIFGGCVEKGKRRRDVLNENFQDPDLEKKGREQSLEKREETCQLSEGYLTSKSQSQKREG